MRTPRHWPAAAPQLGGTHQADENRLSITSGLNIVTCRWTYNKSREMNSLGIFPFYALVNTNIARTLTNIFSPATLFIWSSRLLSHSRRFRKTYLQQIKYQRKEDANNEELEAPRKHVAFCNRRHSVNWVSQTSVKDTFRTMSFTVPVTNLFVLKRKCHSQSTTNAISIQQKIVFTHDKENFGTSFSTNDWWLVCHTTLLPSAYSSIITGKLPDIICEIKLAIVKEQCGTCKLGLKPGEDTAGWGGGDRPSSWKPSIPGIQFNLSNVPNDPPPDPQMFNSELPSWKSNS